ncbi:hypothetical protein AAH978_19640, partial [Streptomyces sp. ZYX-F-203]
QITWLNGKHTTRPLPHVIAVTGGTGVYCEARGQIRVVRIESDPRGGLYEFQVVAGRKCPAA